MIGLWTALALAQTPVPEALPPEFPEYFTSEVDSASPPLPPEVPAFVASPSPVDPLYERLIGSGQMGLDGGDALSTALDGPSYGVWGLALGLAALGAGGYALRRMRRGLPLVGRPLRLVAQVPLGGNATASLLEVEVDGSVERYLVGTGSGAPALLAQVGARFPALDDAPPRSRREVSQEEPDVEPPDPWPAYTRARELERASTPAETPAAPRTEPPPAVRSASAARFREVERQSADDRAAAYRPVRSANEAKALVDAVLAARGDGNPR